MKTLTLLLFVLWLCPMPLPAQSADALLQQVADALAAGKDEYAVSLFRQAVGAGAEQSEMFYWTRVEKSSAAVPRLVQELAAHYRYKRNYDKAYLFYKEWLQRCPEEVPCLVACAEMQLMRGEEKGALRLYEKVLALDADNLQANIYIGNYYYLRAEQQKKALEDNYKKIASSTRMQYANFRNALSEVFADGYHKAEHYLQKVLQLFPSTEAVNTLERIKQLEKKEY